MAKSFIYPNSNLLTATITDGTVSIGPPNTFSSSDSITNEERINDLSIATEISGVGVDDGIRIDLGSSQTCNAIMVYTSAADTNNVNLYGGSGATSMNNSAEYSFTSLSAGWNIGTFSDAASQYWFLHHDGAIAYAEVVLGKKYDFDLAFDLNNTIGEQYANTMNESYGGIEYVTKRHGAKTVWEWNWANISASMKTSLESVRDAVEGDYKKFIYYDETSYYWVRMSKDSLKFTEIAFNRYSTNMKLTEQLQ
ncbi:MAG: hypothetical protein ACE5D7_08280 [Fidelibacterota bacterium]